MKTPKINSLLILTRYLLVVLAVVTAFLACNFTSLELPKYTYAPTQPKPGLSFVTPSDKPNNPTLTPTAQQTKFIIEATSSPTQGEKVRFAVIGDYGSGNQHESDVAALVKSWNTDFIITTGDNNYPDGSEKTIDQNIGKYFHEFIYPYQGSFGTGASQNKFFPSLGNHDWITDNAQPYLDYFTLPGNERYYSFLWGPVHMFSMDSDSNEPDGVGLSSLQATWLSNELLSSTLPWKIVFMHHPPYSSGYHGSVDWARWSYDEWGATVVIAGHDHTYERLIIDGFPYFVNGLGGGDIYYFPDILAGSEVRYNNDYGAMLITADTSSVLIQFFSIQNDLIDEYKILHD